MRRLFGSKTRLGAAALIACGLICGLALAYYSGATSTATAAGTIGSLPAPTNVNAQADGPAVDVSWQGVTVPTGDQVDGYYVQRVSGNTTTPACGSSAGNLLSASANSCTDTGSPAGNGVPGGNYTYNVVAVWHTWSSTGSSGSVSVSGPAVTSTNPSSADLGASNIDVTITGSNFVDGATVSFGPNVTVNTVTYNSQTSLTANISIPAGSAASGPVNVTVHNPDRDTATGGGAFTVNAAPTVTQLQPDAADQGATNDNITITGTDFENGAGVAFANNGITVNHTTFVSSTQLTANITIASGASTGTTSATVTNPDGSRATAAGRVYWVNGGCCTSTPSIGTIGEANLDGSNPNQSFIDPPGNSTNLQGLALSSAGIYWADAARGTIGRANLDGSGATDAFITGLRSTSGMVVDNKYIYWAQLNQGWIARSNLDGSGQQLSFIQGATEPGGVAVAGGYIYWLNSCFSGPQCHLTIGRANIDGSNPIQNFVTSPTLSSGLPGYVAVAGGYVYWTDPSNNSIGRANIDGSGATDRFIPNQGQPLGIAATQSELYWSNYSANTISAANLDGTNVKTLVTGAANPYGVAVSDGFTVNAAPTVTSASPSAEPAGATNKNITINGTSFESSATVQFSNPGITVNGSPTFVSSTQLTVNVSIASGAGTGAGDVTVSNPDGSSATGTGVFSVNPTPTMSGLDRSLGDQGASNYKMTINGSGFQTGAAASFSNTGITVNSTTVVSSSQIVANISIASGATTGAGDVTVNNPDGGSVTDSKAFTVNAAPTQSLSLASGAVGAFKSGTNVYFNGNNSGSLQLVDTVSTSGAATPVSASFPDVSTSGWGHGAETVSTPSGGPYASSSFTWSAMPGSPSGYAVTGSDNAGGSVSTPLNFIDDTTPPMGAVLQVNGVAASTNGTSSKTDSSSFPINVRTDYSEAQSSTQSGLNSSVLTVQSFATTGQVPGAGSCTANPAGPFTSQTPIANTSQPSGILAGYCYVYTLTGTDNVGNSASISTTVQVAPTLWAIADSINQGNGSAVTSWPDSSLFSDTLTTGLTPPAYETNVWNGHAAVAFNGSAANLLSANNMAGGSAPYDVFTVAEPSAGSYGYTPGYLGWGVESTGQEVALRANDGNNNGLDTYWFSFDDYQQNAQVAHTAPNVIETYWNGTNRGMSVNGASLSNYSLPGSDKNTAVTKFRLGSVDVAGQQFNQPFDGDIAETVVYQGVLSASERSAIASYLEQKYFGTLAVNSTSPSSAEQGQSNVNVTINGSGFADGATASFSNPGITVNSTIFVSTSQLTANISIAKSASIGAGDATVTNPDGSQATGGGVFTVSTHPQTINFTSAAPTNAVVGGPGYVVTATGGASGNPVSFTIDSSSTTVCSISGATVSLTGAGTCTIDANQAGNANYSAAPQAQQSFAVGAGSQTITFSSIAPGDAVVGGATYAVAATGGASGNPVTFTIDSSSASVCSVSGSTVSFTATGTCTIDANQAGNANYTAAPQVQQSFTVSSGHIYWANFESAGTIGRANLDGTGVDTSFVAGAAQPTGPTNNTTGIYWADTSTIATANIGGTNVNENFITGCNSPYTVAVNSSYVYWTNYGSNTIGRANINGTGVNQAFITGADEPIGLAIDGSYIYWTNSGNGTIGRAAINGTGVTQSFVTGAADPQGVAINGSYVYWSNKATIGRANLNGTSPTQSFITTVSGLTGITVTASSIYWTNSNGHIGTASLSGTGVNSNFITLTGEDPYGLTIGP